MIWGTLAKLIKEKITYTHLLIFVLVISFIGIGLEIFEPYTMFWLLFPVLLIMFISIVLILQFCLKELQRFQETCTDDSLKMSCKSLFYEKSNCSLLLAIYVLMVIVYFTCLYRLKFVEINLMGLFIFLLGGGTFFLALISYEVCVRLTISLTKTAQNISEIKYDAIYPKGTLWLQHFFRLYKILRNAALVVSVLFVLENSMIFIANSRAHFSPSLSDEVTFPEILKCFPIEWWVIWIYIFITVVVALPIMMQLQNRSLKNIVLHIQVMFNKEFTKELVYDELYTNPQKYCSILSTIQFVQNSLEEAYLPKRIDKIISLCASLLTCFTHLISFYMILFPN